MIDSSINQLSIYLSMSYLCDSHLCVLLLLLQLLLEKLQVVLRRQRGERSGARAAGSDALGCHSEEWPSIKVLSAEKTQKNKGKVIFNALKHALSWNVGCHSSGIRFPDTLNKQWTSVLALRSHTAASFSSFLHNRSYFWTLDTRWMQLMNQ